MTPSFIEVTPQRRVHERGVERWITAFRIWLNVQHIVSISVAEPFAVISLADNCQYYVPVEQVESLIGVRA